ncbi:spore germination protein GerPE [Niallia sp. 01092]|uniref:spore germination protein GerPE n=1 Tax=unclassified Niallia TaxID=2837522 RepID=UPI003FD519E0
MLERTSVVDHINLNILSFSSFFEIGDASYFQASSRALAVQRQKKLFYGIEGSFNDYPVFFEPIPLPPIQEDIQCQFENKKPIIKVKHINIIAVSASSLLQIGNCANIYAETRIKHIRQLSNPQAEPDGDSLIKLQAANGQLN